MQIHKVLIFCFLLFSNIVADIIEINEEIPSVDILSGASIYLDKTKNMTIDDIANNDMLFHKNDQSILSYGYSPKFDVWIKIKVRNNSDKKTTKIIEYQNPLTTSITLYDISSNTVYTEGLLHRNDDRKTLNPSFKIELEAQQTKIFYIKASSDITTLIVKLNLWNIDSFYSNEIIHQLILALFFGAMVILAMYNFVIYFYVRDISYLFYFIYIIGIVIHHLIYVGMANVYFVNQETMSHIVKYAAIFIAIPVLALAFFSKTFLRTNKYPRLNKILNILIILVPISVIVFVTTEEFNQYRNLFVVLLLVYIIFVTIYAGIKKNKQAYFILLGWTIMFLSGICMYLSSAGIFDIYQHYQYIVETGLVLEALIFSIALANKINILQSEKDDANHKLLIQQQNETIKLEAVVSQKTNDLQIALQEKEVLLKELNHRVKNNMQTILSLIRLQSDKVTDTKIKEIFITIQNRINAMNHLHILLYNNGKNMAFVNAYEYFEMIIEELQETYYSENIEIKFDVNTILHSDEAIYCGLILNELITNSLKYAFVDGKGTININLSKVNGSYHLIVSDNGKGFPENVTKGSLGLVLVDILVKEQLKGEVEINSTQNIGTTITIKWEEK